MFFKSSILLYTYLIMLIMKTFLVMVFGALSIIRPSMQLFVICKCVFSHKKFFYKFHIHVSVFHVQFEHVFQVGWVP